MKEIKTEEFVEVLCEVDPNHEAEIKALEEKYNCSISCDIEKHSALQFTYFYNIDFDKEELFYVEIESGINNGTQVNSAEWGTDTKSNTKTVQILEDIILDSSCYVEGSLLKKKAEAVLSANKSKLFEFHRQDSYDNYVTGGQSKMKLDSLLSQLQLEYVYKELEVDCNFV